MLNTLELDRLYVHYRDQKEGPDKDMMEFIDKLGDLTVMMRKLYESEFDKERVSKIQDATQCNFKEAAKADVLFSGDIDKAVSYIMKKWDPVATRLRNL